MTLKKTILILAAIAFVAFASGCGDACFQTDMPGIDCLV